MDDAAESDIVDEPHAAYVRPLGNLVITFAKAEAALLDLLAAFNGEDEKTAQQILKDRDAKERTLSLFQASGIKGFDLDELLDGLNRYWCDKERRNRYMHDEWYVGIYAEEGTAVAVTGTRGTPRRKGSDVAWDQPTPSEVWELARRFREHEHLFSFRAYAFRKAAEPGVSSEP